MSDSWRDVLMRDHELTEQVFATMEKLLATPDGPEPATVAKLLEYVRDYVDRCHNMKEEQHLFPMLEQRGLPRTSGPVSVMLAEHEAARALIFRMEPLAKAYAGGDRGRLAELRAVFGEYAALCKDHYWKENDVLFPLAMRTLGDADAAAVLRGIEQLEASLGPDTRARYQAMAGAIITSGGLKDLAHGLDHDTLAAILNTLPIELSFVDQNDTVRYFSHERAEKIFPRTRGVIGSRVQNCHPQQSVHLVNRILADFKAGQREVAEFWIDMGPRKVHIRYWPVRDAAGRYLGCLETVQDVAPIQKLTGQRRLLDEG